MPESHSYDERSLQELRRTWEVLGQDDPLWAVLSFPEKRGRRWNPEEFLATGERDVAAMHSLLRHRAKAPVEFRHVLDFGCGAGRLTLAWSHRAQMATGVDIAATMVERARQLTANRSNVRFHQSPHPDLRGFPDGTFDLVTSLICLQHMPWELARGYVREFGRVCEPGGWVVFQLPAARKARTNTASIRRKLVDALPCGLAAKYRRWRHGAGAVFDMHFTPRDAVEAEAARCGLVLLAAEPDDSAGDGTEGFLYVFERERSSDR